MCGYLWVLGTQQGTHCLHPGPAGAYGLMAKEDDRKVNSLWAGHLPCAPPEPPPYLPVVWGALGREVGKGASSVASLPSGSVWVRTLNGGAGRWAPGAYGPIPSAGPGVTQLLFCWLEISPSHGCFKPGTGTALPGFGFPNLKNPSINRPPVSFFPVTHLKAPPVTTGP